MGITTHRYAITTGTTTTQPIPISIPPMAFPAAGSSTLRSVEPCDRPLHATASTFVGVPSDRHQD